DAPNSRMLGPAGEHEQAATGSYIPKLCRAVIASSREQSAIGAERKVVDGTAMRIQPEWLGMGMRIPHPRISVDVAGCVQLPIRIGCNCPDGGFLAQQLGDV